MESKYKSLTEWRKADLKAYNYARVNNLLEKICEKNNWKLNFRAPNGYIKVSVLDELEGIIETIDINKRIETHNKGKGSRYTKTRLPVVLRASFDGFDKSTAAKEEYRIKQLNREEKLKLCYIYE